MEFFFFTPPPAPPCSKLEVGWIDLVNYYSHLDIVILILGTNKLYNIT